MNFSLAGFVLFAFVLLLTVGVCVWFVDFEVYTAFKRIGGGELQGKLTDR